MCVLTECQKYAGTKLQDVCQYERKKQKNKKKQKTKQNKQNKV